MARGLVGDVGGTHARFARLAANGRLAVPIERPSAELADLAGALRDAGERLDVGLAGLSAAVAVAGPVAGDAVELTNVGWRFSIAATRDALGLGRLVVLNDFEAVARSLPLLGEDDLETWRDGEPVDGSPKALIGPGTGLGVGALVRCGASWLALPGEGGHRDLAARNEREWRIVERLAARFGRASAERALSGPGLVALHEAVCEIEGRRIEALDPEEISRRATAGESVACREACDLFSGWLGAVAGDLVLTLGARGGLYLAGGMLAAMAEAFDRARFFSRLDGKGRFREYVRRVPVHRILSPSTAALRGAASALDS